MFGVDDAILIPSLITAGSQLVGGFMGQSAQQSANQMSKDMAREQMAFQERMSSTAYQRAVADMKRAGINPAMAYSQGGASSPGGAIGQVQVADELAKGVSRSASSAFESMNAWKDLKAKDADIKVANAIEKKEKEEAKLLSNSAKKVELESDKQYLENHMFRNSLPSLKAHNQYLLKKYKVESKPGMVWTGSIMDKIGSVFGGGFNVGATKLIK